jgi:hypothetical protein
MAYAQDTCESQNHDDTGKYLKNAIDGVEHPLDSDFWKHQSITALFDARAIKKMGESKNSRQIESQAPGHSLHR